jgi:hypothetical protein
VLDYSLTYAITMSGKGISMDSFEYNVDEKIRPSVERALTGTTKIDSEISSLPMPDEGLGKKSAVLLLRIYRRLTPHAKR